MTTASRRDRPHRSRGAARLLAWLPVALPVFVGLTLVLAPRSGAHADDQPPPKYQHGERVGPLPRKDLQPLTDPAKIWQRDCATCHGADAQGSARAPSLYGKGRADVYYWVSTGRMPILNVTDRIGRAAPAYPPEVVNALVDYVATLAGGGGTDLPTVGPGNVADGLHLFGLYCASCHAWSGNGSIIFNGKAPTVAPATDEQIAAAIRIGPGQMPAFGTAAIDDKQLNDVVAYVGTLRDKKDQGGWGIFHRGPTTEGGAALVLGLGSLLLAVGWIGTKAKSRVVE